MERYESLGPVGEGSYGTVLKCRHRESGRLVAIKKFMDSDDDETVKKIALREIKLLRQLRHDNLVNLLEVWKRRRRWYLVFEFVDRTLLDDLEQNPNGLDLNTCRQYLFQVLRAADFCHQQNVIHRDIKPENILISQEGVVKLCDFGFARTIPSPSEGNVYTDYVATRWYRAPELLVGDIKYGKPVDVWALGCLLIETLTGQPLFPGDSDLDQIYHIVKCFGNLMTHHQELFYRNPIFSGVKLPECSRTVPLQQRFPSVTPTAFDLAQRCLEMDPERRASCSELLEHLFFTQDSFHIRFLEDLNAKIQKEHRENSTLPKITKSQGQERNKGDEKNCQGKEKKQPEDMDEKVNKPKMEKTKGKQPSKLSKPIQSTTNSSVHKQPKTFGNKGNHNATPHSTKNKPDKNTGAELKKDSEISKSTKSLNSKSADETKTTSQKKKNSMAVKPKHEGSVTPEPRRNLLQNVKNLNYSSPDAEKNSMKERSFSKSETNQEFTKTWSNPNLKVPKLSKTLNSDSQSLNSSPKTVLDFNISLGPKSSQLSISDSTVVSAPLMLQDTRSCKMSPSSEHQTNQVESDAEQRTSENPKVFPQNLKTLEVTLTGPKTDTNISTSSSKTFNLEHPEQSAVIIEVSPVHNTAALSKGTSNLNVSKTGCTPKKELAEDKSIKKNHGYLKMNPGAETPTASALLSLTSSGGPESSEPPFTGLQNTKVTTEGRYTSTPVLNKNLSLGTSVLKTLKVSDKENQEDSAPLSVSIKSLTNPLINQTLIASGSSSNRRNSSDSTSEAKFFKIPHLKQSPSKTGSFSDHMRPPATPKSQKTMFALDAKRKMDTKEGNEKTSLSRELTPIVSVNQQASTRSFNLHKMDISDFSGFDFNGPQSSTPPPPPPSSFNLLLLPPSSQSLIHSHSVFSTNNPTDHLIQGAGFHPGTNSLRCVDKPRHYGGVYDRQVQQFAAGHVTGSATIQASDSSFISKVSKNRSHVYFPDVRSSMLPELRGREDLSTFYGKNNKASIKNLRKDKNPVSLSPSSDVQQQQGVNISTNTPKQ